MHRYAAAEFRSASVLVLAAMNVVPLLGVLVLGWDVGLILLLFWCESAVVGVLQVVRIALTGQAAATFLIPFFMVHYGLFMAVHLVFLLVLFFLGGIFGDAGTPTAFPAGIPLGTLFGPFGWVALAALAFTHVASFVLNDLRERPWRHQSVQQVMMEPYQRIVVMHLTILLAGVPAALLGSPWFAVALLVVLKTVVDVVAHIRKRRRRHGPDAPPPRPARRHPMFAGPS